MKILSITTKTGSAVIDPSTGKPAHYIVAGPVTEIGYMPGGLALYVRRVGMSEAQVVPMGSVARMTVDMPALGKEVVIAARGAPTVINEAAGTEEREAYERAAPAHALAALTAEPPPAPAGSVLVGTALTPAGEAVVTGGAAPAEAEAMIARDGGSVLGGASVPGKSEALRQAGAEPVRPSRREKRRRR